MAGTVLTTVLAVMGRLPPDLAARLQDPTRPLTFFTGIGLSFALVMGAFLVCAWLLQGKRFTDLVGRWRWRLVARGFLAWLAVMAVNSLADLLLVPKGFSWIADGRTAAFALSALPALVLQTFAEELIFRGFITQGLVAAFRRPFVAALLSGLIFGIVHIPNGPMQALTAGVFGVALALLAIETGGIALGWGIHLANNLFAAVVIVSASDVFHGARALVRQDTPQLAGFDFVFTLAALVLLIVLWTGARPRSG